MRLSRLQWIGVLALTLFIVMFEYLTHFVLHPLILSEQEVYLLIVAVVSLGAVVFVHTLFAAIRRMQRELVHRKQEIEALYQISTEILAESHTDRVLDLVVEKTRQLLGSDVAILCLRNKATGQSTVRVTSGAAPFATTDLTTGACRETCGDGSGSTSDVGDRPPDCAILGEMGFDGRLTLPLRRGKTTIGTLCLGTRAPISSIRPNAQLLSSLANQAAIAAENVRLYQQTQQLAVLEERDRIAREMHDGLAQILGFISAKTQAARAMLASDQENQAVQALEHVHQVSQEAYADVRECILGLKTGISPGRGLWPTLTEYLRKYRLQTGIQVELILANGAGEAYLSPAVEVQLLGIIQEALTNVRKHAQATRAWIRVDTEQERLQVKVTDNGCGFDPQTSAVNAALTFGLQNMRERARSVGGTFEIQSSHQEGTTIVVHMPLAAGELAS